MAALTAFFTDSGSVAANMTGNSARWLSARSDAVHLPSWLDMVSEDPGFQGFLPKLKEYILCRLHGIPTYTGVRNNHAFNFTDAERDAVNVIGDIFYRHTFLYIRYVSFNGYPALEPLKRSSGDFMMYNPDSWDIAGDYRYGRIVDIFHLFVKSPIDGRIRRLNVLYVRWFEIDPRHNADAPNGNYPTHCPPRLRFLPAEDPSAFSFLDPAQVIRRVQLLPSNTDGRTAALLGPSAVRYHVNDNRDFAYYHVDCLSDHDLTFRVHQPPCLYHFTRVEMTPGHISEEHYQAAAPHPDEVDHEVFCPIGHGENKAVIADENEIHDLGEGSTSEGAVIVDAEVAEFPDFLRGMPMD